jgi:hypothetical protein
MRVRVSLASRRRKKDRRARLGEFGVIEFYLKLPKKKICWRKENLIIRCGCSYSGVQSRESPTFID